MAEGDRLFPRPVSRRDLLSRVSSGVALAVVASPESKVIAEARAAVPPGENGRCGAVDIMIGASLAEISLKGTAYNRALDEPKRRLFYFDRTEESFS